jgi:hypothetical protein
MSKHDEEKGQATSQNHQAPKAGTGQTQRPTAGTQAAADQPVVPMDVGAEGVRAEGIETPTVTALAPDTAVAGEGEQVTMVVEGTGFHPKSVIMFNGNDEPTTFISSTKLSTGVKPSLFVEPVACQVAVRNAGFPASNEMPFTFTEAGAPAAMSKKR